MSDVLVDERMLSCAQETHEKTASIGHKQLLSFHSDGRQLADSLPAVKQHSQKYLGKGH